MADDPAAPSLHLTPEEKRVFGQLFRQADSEGIGVVTGEVAVKFFGKTRLEPRILGEIWQIADKENRGLLTPAGFGIVLRLVGHYQAGHAPTPELALRPGPLPKFDGGIGASSPIFQPPPGPPPSALQPQGSGSGPIRVPPLTPEKATQYAQLFEKSGIQHGVLPGEQAKQIFERAGLPNEILGRVWNLADTEQRGALLATEFVIAMHLIASYKVGALRALPTILPAGLYEAASRLTPSRQSSGAISAVSKQFSGNQARPSSPLNRSGFGASPPSFQGSGLGGDWAISTGDKAKFDGIYNGLDRTNKGYITGDEAVPFFSESKLPEEALAQIWDLADINSAGHLTRDEFAVAMYLIRQQRDKRDGRDTLPTTLPPNLIPPSMRNQARPDSLTTAPAFENPTTPTMPKSAAEDLFGLDALTSPVPAPIQAPQSTGGSSGITGSRNLNPDHVASRPSPLTPNSTSNISSSTVFRSFVPSSSFGQTLTQHTTGGSNSSGPSQSRNVPQQNPVAEDLLGDNDPDVSKKLTHETSELANLSNQVGNLSKQMHEVQGQRTNSQIALTEANSQKRQFEERLTQLRSLYEQEVGDVKNLEERLAASRNETMKLQSDIAVLEGTYQDLQNQHRQTVSALQTDQQENASLKERMRVMNMEISQLKPTLEKLRSDARQQKGLVAINKKQLATNEAERDKLKSEADELKKSIDEDTKTLAAASKVQSLASSPALSNMGANNPFFRRQPSLGGDKSSSPYAATSPSTSQTDQTFDSVFGPSFTTAGGSQPLSQQTNEARSLKSKSGTIPTRTHSATSITTPQSASSREFSQQIEPPPPPPESRQISSSYLPFPAENHEESLSSSRQVSAPNSRFGDESTGVNTPTNHLDTMSTHSTTTQQLETASGASSNLDRAPTTPPAPDPKDAIPGAFPGDNILDMVATPTDGSSSSEQAASDTRGKKDFVRSGSAKKDFDAAFAGFDNTPRAQDHSATGHSPTEESSAAPTATSIEFPPIREVGHNDDSSDTASEHAGFEDDFAPESPSQTKKGTTAQKSTPRHGASSSTGSDNNNLTRAGLSANRSVDPPARSAQNSPPPYDGNSRADADRYSDLLPSSNVPRPTEKSGNEYPLTSNATTFGAPQISSQPEAPAKVAFDDDFDNFDDLEDAKEGDADDDFANISAHSRSAIDDFNPMFDSPITSKGNSGPAKNASLAGNAFGDHTEEPTPFTPPATNTSAVNDTHDWDAIFAGLEGPSNASTKIAELKDTSSGTALNSVQAERPSNGRAFTDTSIHDDPILKNLTGMGYTRSHALAALEKYDYNLERAANYLASQS